MVSIDDPEDPSPYGAHWLGVRGETLDTLNPLGTFRASGYEGQTITLCPALDLMVVRLGKTAHEREDFLVPWRAAMVQAFADAAAPLSEPEAQAPLGVVTKTGICRSVFSWYSA